MGRTVTPTYAVQFFNVRSNGRLVGWTTMGWNSKQSGRPTAANLKAFIKTYEDSTLPTGVNRHLGASTVGSARIVRNDGTYAMVAEYHA